MHLPGRLSTSTLGDLLGSLHRESITGTMELRELAGPSGRGVPGRVHRVHLRGGLVVGVDTALPASGPTPRAVLRARLDQLFSLEDAAIAFRIARPLPDAVRAAPLGPAEFLHGRPRRRDRGRTPRDEPRRDPRPPAAEDPSERARRLLGISRGAGLGEVRRAFRRMASALHPDRLGAAALEEQQQMAARFAELSAAYHLLVA